MFFGKFDNIECTIEYILMLLLFPFMLYLNYQLATFICKYVRISFHFTLTTISPGFGNNIIILLIFIEIIVFIYIFEKLIPAIAHKIV